MQPPKIFYFGHADRLAPTIFTSIQQLFDLVSVTLDANDLSHIRKITKRNIVIIEHAPNNKESFNIIRIIKHFAQDLPIILITKNPSRAELIQAMRLGISDIFMLSEPTEELISRIWHYSHANKKSSKLRIFLEQYGIPQIVKKWIHRLFFTVKKASAPASVAYTGLPLPIGLNLMESTLFNSRLHIKLLGRLSIKTNEKEWVSIKSQKASALLSFLLFHHQKKIHKELLMTTFWGNSSPGSAKNCLHVTICALRKYISKALPGEELIIYKDHCYGIDSNFELHVDVEKFEENWKRGKFLEQSEGLDAAIEYFEKAYTYYQEDFLNQIHLENWVESERDHFREMYLIILDRLSWHYYQKEKYLFAIQLCQEALKKDNCLEEIHCRLMRCYQKVGLRSKAIRQFHKCKQILEKELDMQPSSTTFNLLEQLKNQLEKNTVLEEMN